MDSKLSFFLNRLLQISLLVAGGYLLYQLSKPIDDWMSITEVKGMKQLTAFEVYAELEKSELDKKSFLGINPIKINKELKKHPLIDTVTTRRFLYPNKKIKIYVEETIPWAFYGEQIVARTGYVIAKLDDPELSSRIKELFLSMKNNLVQISSYSSIDQSKLLTLKSLAEIIEGSTGQRILKIVGDREENFSLRSKKLDFRVGLLKNKVLKRAERLSLINEQIDHYKKEIDYVDLSLSTSEVILGKKKGKARNQIVVQAKKTHKPELETLDPFNTPDEELGGELEPSHG